MDQEKGSLEQQWETFYRKNRKKQKLEFRYNKKDSKTAEIIVEALVFWRFVLESFPWDYFSESADQWMKRQSDLFSFRENVNPFIGLIATIESLPTMVWRRSLWKYNIDFMSFESFLRRITTEQIMAILGNYEDLYGSNKIPRVFSRWDCLTRRLSVEKILSEEYHYEKRYINKGAMSYNLLGLDFGFNAYPKGINDDTKVVEISPLRFLSIKNHADDFVVNQEDGKYWWLYKTARSNYAIKPDKKVELKTHVCPGFWYTILIHLLFWFISPMAFFGWLQNSLQFNPGVIALGAIGLFTPSWILVACVRFIVKRTNLDEIFESAVDFWRRYEKVWFSFLVCGLTILYPFLLFDAIGLMVDVYDFLLPRLGFLWSVLVISMIPSICIYVVYLRVFAGIKSFSEIPKTFKMIMKIFLVGLLLKFAHMHLDYILMKIVSVFRWLGEAWYFIVENPSYVVVFSLYFAICFLLWLGAKMEDEKQKKWFYFFERIGFYATLASLGLFIYSMAILVFAEGFNRIQVVALIGFSCLFFLIFRLFAWELNPEVKESKKAAEHIVARIGNSRKNTVDYRSVMKNQWLRNLSAEERNDVLLLISGIIDNLFHCGNKTYRAINILIPVLNPEIIALIQANQGNFYSYGQQRRLGIIEKMALGYSFDDAQSIAFEEERRKEAIERDREKFWRKVKKALRIVFSPIIFLGWIIAKLIEASTTLYRLYKLFNERCPYITQKKVLRID